MPEVIINGPEGRLECRYMPAEAADAPTALFRCLEIIEEEGARPAAIIGCPVGFVGAAESKAALATTKKVPFFAVHGTRGGSAMASAVVNALALLGRGTDS